MPLSTMRMRKKYVQKHPSLSPLEFEMHRRKCIFLSLFVVLRSWDEEADCVLCWEFYFVGRKVNRDCDPQLQREDRHCNLTTVRDDSAEDADRRDGSTASATTIEHCVRSLLQPRFDPQHSCTAWMRPRRLHGVAWKLARVYKSARQKV